MVLAEFDGAVALHDSAWPLLTADEANHTVLLSIVQTARAAAARGDQGVEPLRGYLVVDGDAGPVAVAVLSRENWLLSTGPAEALALLGRSLRGQAFDAVVGPAASVEGFMAAHGGCFAPHFRLPLMRLDAPLAPPSAPGALRLATPADRDLVLQWSEAFHAEARLADPIERVRRNVLRALDDPEGQFRLWEPTPGQPACMVGGRRIAPSGARIGPVYTPPELRGRGHGQAAVTACTVALQTAGARTVFLFTDASNPTSNALYRRIGFVPAGEHLHMRLVGAA